MALWVTVLLSLGPYYFFPCRRTINSNTVSGFFVIRLTRDPPFVLPPHEELMRIPQLLIGTTGNPIYTRHRTDRPEDRHFYYRSLHERLSLPEVFTAFVPIETQVAIAYLLVNQGQVYRFVTDLSTLTGECLPIRGIQGYVEASTRPQVPAAAPAVRSATPVPTPVPTPVTGFPSAFMSSMHGTPFSVDFMQQSPTSPGFLGQDNFMEVLDWMSQLPVAVPLAADMQLGYHVMGAVMNWFGQYAHQLNPSAQSDISTLQQMEWATLTAAEPAVQDTTEDAVTTDPVARELIFDDDANVDGDSIAFGDEANQCFFERVAAIEAIEAAQQGANDMRFAMDLDQSEQSEHDGESGASTDEDGDVVCGTPPCATMPRADTDTFYVPETPGLQQPAEQLQLPRMVQSQQPSNVHAEPIMPPLDEGLMMWFGQGGNYSYAYMAWIHQLLSGVQGIHTHHGMNMGVHTFHQGWNLLSNFLQNAGPEGTALLEELTVTIPNTVGEVIGAVATEVLAIGPGGTVNSYYQDHLQEAFLDDLQLLETFRAWVLKLQGLLQRYATQNHQQLPAQPQQATLTGRHMSTLSYMQARIVSRFPGNLFQVARMAQSYGLVQNIPADDGLPQLPEHMVSDELMTFAIECGWRVVLRGGVCFPEHIHNLEPYVMNWLRRQSDPTWGNFAYIHIAATMHPAGFRIRHSAQVVLSGPGASAAAMLLTTTFTMDSTPIERYPWTHSHSAGFRTLHATNMEREEVAAYSAWVRQVYTILSSQQATMVMMAAISAQEARQVQQTVVVAPAMVARGVQGRGGQGLSGRGRGRGFAAPRQAASAAPSGGAGASIGPNVLPRNNAPRPQPAFTANQIAAARRLLQVDEDYLMNASPSPSPDAN